MERCEDASPTVNLAVPPYEQSETEGEREPLRIPRETA